MIFFYIKSFSRLFKKDCLSRTCSHVPNAFFSVLGSILQIGSCNRICHLKHIHARILLIKLYEACESANILFAVFLKCNLPVGRKDQPIIVINLFFADESIRVVTDE